MRAAAIIAALAFAAPVGAAEVRPCDGRTESAANLAEPWEAHTRTFANGDVRLAVIDQVEPAAAAFHLLILSPPRDELGIPQCRLVGGGGGLGLAGLSLDGLAAAYDPARGLVWSLPAQLFDPATGGFAPATLIVTLNQSTGAVTARTEPR
jgi:hypothetical protein